MRISRAFLIIAVLLCGGNSSASAFQTDGAITDTTYFKTLKYVKLNSLVGYHVLKNGKPTNRQSLEYLVKPIATYYYYNHSYVIDKKDTSLRAKPADVTKLLMSNKFSNKTGFDGLFKVNSKIIFLIKPGILKKITVIPKVKNDGQLRTLVGKLRKEKFVSQLELDTAKTTILVSGNRDTYITILLKADYQGIKNTRDIEIELKKWPEIKDVISSVRFFTGRSEYETIFRITSQEKK